MNFKLVKTFNFQVISQAQEQTAKLLASKFCRGLQTKEKQD